MTRQDLAERFHAVDRRSRWVFGPWLAAFFGALFLLYVLSPKGPSSGLWVAGLFAFLIANWVGVMLVTRRMMRDGGLSCSRCSQVLNRDGLQRALATGVCNRCNQKFLED